MISSTAAQKTSPTNTKSVYILSFLDRLIQRVKKTINESWIIPNPNNVNINIANTIQFKIETSAQGIENPKIVSSLKTLQERAEKIISIAEQLLSRLSNERSNNKKTLEECIQMVCSYAFKSWISNNTKKLLSEKIQQILDSKENSESTSATSTHLNETPVEKFNDFTSQQYPLNIPNANEEPNQNLQKNCKTAKKTTFNYRKKLKQQTITQRLIGRKAQFKFYLIIKK